LSLALALAANAELTRLVDDRLDPQDQAEFVVHLQPIVLDTMLDPGTGPAIFLAEGQDFAIERMEPATEESEDVLSGEVQEGRVV
jgi:hypothetical protein